MSNWPEPSSTEEGRGMIFTAGCAGSAAGDGGADWAGLGDEGGVWAAARSGRKARVNVIRRIRIAGREDGTVLGRREGLAKRASEEGMEIARGKR